MCVRHTLWLNNEWVMPSFVYGLIIVTKGGVFKDKTQGELSPQKKVDKF